MSDTCGDDRFELIAKAKQKLLDATNIKSSPDEIAVLDNILFRCWQMGWLDQLRDADTRWHELFGTPERAAVTLVRTSDERAVCKLPTWTASSNDYEAWLEWLKGDA
jgi:hypothetical protein